MDEHVETVVLFDTFDLQVLPLYMERDTGLVQPAKLSMTLVKPVERASLRIRVDGRARDCSLEGTQLGTVERKIEIPEITKPGEIVVELRDGEEPVFSKTFNVNSNKWLNQLPINNGHVYAYVMNNYWFTNYKASQGGQLDFRFALTSGTSIPAAEVARFGRDWSAAERRTIRQMISADPNNVMLSAFKRSEDGKGYIARLREMSGKATRATLHVPALAGAKDAFLATGVEDVVGELSLQSNTVAVDLDPWDVVTVRIE